MKHLNPVVLLLGLALAGAPAVAIHAQEGPPGQWQPAEPPGQWSRAWHSGFRDGIDAARHDIDARRQPDARRHDKFRHPDLSRDQRPDFRRGFERGYHMEYDHYWHGRYGQHHDDDGGPRP